MNDDTTQPNLTHIDLNPVRVGMWINTLISCFRLIKFNPSPENNIILGVLLVQLFKTHMDKQSYLTNMSNIWDIDEKLSSELEYLDDGKEPVHEDPLKGH